MRQAVHRAVREEREDRDVEACDRNCEAQPLLREPAEDEKKRDQHPEHERRLAPREDPPRVAAVARRRHADGKNDRDDRTQRGNAHKPDRTRIRQAFVVLERRDDRRDDGRGDKTADQRILGRVDERRDRRRNARPAVLGDEDESRKENDRGAESAAIERDLLGPLLVPAPLEENRRDNGADENRDAEHDRRGGRRGDDLADNRLVLVDDIRLHVLVGAQELADLQHLPGEPDRDEIDEHVAEHADVLERDDQRQRHDREKEHLVVREAEAEHKRRKPQDLVGGLAHPAIAEQEHPHQKKRVQRIDLDNGRLRPLDRRKRKGQGAADTAAERKQRVGSWQLAAGGS